MSRLRWRKILRDLRQNSWRSVLAIFAMVIGIFAVGSILTAYAILDREINVNFLRTNPASAILYVDSADRGVADAVAHLPGIAAAEPRRVVNARVALGPDTWRPILLYVVDDFNALRVATFDPEQGAWPPAKDEVLIERSSISNWRPGQQIVVRTPNGQPRELRVSGIVHDAGQAPGWQDGVDYGYITLDTLAALGESRSLDELRIVVAEKPLDVQHIKEVAYQAKGFLEQRGLAVSQVIVPKPGQHPHTDQMNSLLFLLEAFGVLALALSGILVATIMAALLAQQIRQIGVMKAIGARTGQITGLYYGTVLIFGLAALAIGIPLGVIVGRGYAAFTATMLNFDITSNFVPHWTYVVQILVGLSIPLLAASIPIYKGSRMTVREAISDYGIDETEFGTNRVDALVVRVRGLSRPLLLSLRNTFRRRARLVLTVGVLAVSGATFMAALNVGASWTHTVNMAFEYRHYDTEIRLAESYPAARVKEAVDSVAGVADAEYWQQIIGVQKQPDGTDGIRLRLTGLPPATKMIDFPVIEGRWLRPDDTHAMVINNVLRSDREAGIKPGDRIAVKVGDRTMDWNVVGVVREVGAARRGLNSAAYAYVNLDTLARQMGTEGTTNFVHVESTDRSNAALRIFSQQIENRFDAAGLRRITAQLTIDRKQVLLDHLVVIVTFLMVMAVLVAGVGGLALASAMSISVMERTREIGMMRAIGASTHAVLRVIVTEGVVIGVLSWLVALAIAVPVSVMVGNYAGQLFIDANLDHIFPPSVMLGWLGLVVLISLIASSFPAWGATHLTVRDVLAYE
jgi:putative ABC transport system permease protein